ncbi:hypothetical protein TGARI_295030 [Toxoplasma gondii ARI]|uniref:Uncharacterized protein n=1 Tax=Toxoplasma gondii ARI TaxID=1074872 RepID=A0A139XLJ1_TOXGO|nr:hypothetical protein TGARI_295030 [Toxoplasma gondii ARI]
MPDALGSKAATGVGDPTKGPETKLPVAYHEYEDEYCACRAPNRTCQIRVVDSGGRTLRTEADVARGSCCVQEGGGGGKRNHSECCSRATRACDMGSRMFSPLSQSRGTSRRLLPLFDDREVVFPHGQEDGGLEDFPPSPVDASTAASSRRESCRHFLPSATASFDFPHIQALIASALSQPQGSGTGTPEHPCHGSGSRDALEAKSRTERRLFLEPLTAIETLHRFDAVSETSESSRMNGESVLHEPIDAVEETHTPRSATPAHGSELGRVAATMQCALSRREPSALSRCRQTESVETPTSCVRLEHGDLTTDSQPRGCGSVSKIVPARCELEANRQWMRREPEQEYCGEPRYRHTQETELKENAFSDDEQSDCPDCAIGAKFRCSSLPGRFVSVNNIDTALDKKRPLRRCDSPLILFRRHETHESELETTSRRKRTSEPTSRLLQRGKRQLPVRGQTDSSAVAPDRLAARGPATCNRINEGHLRLRQCSRCLSEINHPADAEEDCATGEVLCRPCWRSREISLWKQLTDWRAFIRGLHFLSLQKHYKYQLPNQLDSAAFSVHNRIEKRIFFVVSHTSEPAAAYLPGGWHMSLYLPNPTVQRDVLDVTDPKSTDAFTVIRADLPCGQSLFSYVSRPLMTVNELVHCGESRTTKQKALGYVSMPRSPSTVLRVRDAKRHKLLDIVRRTKGSKSRRMPQEWIAYRPNKNIAARITLFLDEYKSIAGRDATILFDDSANPTTKMLALVCLCYIQLLSFGRCAGAEI